MPETVRSADGTTIAYDQVGSGPSVIAIGGAFNVRQSHAGLADVLAPNFTVYTYDRRGRGDSTDTEPYAVEREIEDLAALIDGAGGSAYVYGHSSGACLALEAASRGLPIPKLVVYEPPYATDEESESGDLSKDIQEAIDAGRPDQAAELFLGNMG
ncbi:MAG: alpha/beta fold hydrolase, partial [Acidimicrobiia bacterium]|nr:alpha/beta fold hydrolase [Acidimicrobiia bacterium]